MASSKLTVPILLNWSDIQAYMEQHDIVKVVRCKDCKHARKYKLFGEEEIQCERSSLDFYFWVDEEDFCSYGEKVKE